MRIAGTRDPLARHELVRQVDRCHRIYANPYHRQGLRLEEALLFCDAIRYQINQLTPAVRMAVLLMAEGYSSSEAAQMAGLSVRSLERCLAATA